ncbi:fimbrial protein [Vibrio hippocampi]|uniref:Fimbrial-type adhesion domain-containing protein n=1 Tax=Vibrio hippocampi TaxID=654686 RepID=A0ABN8DPX5_9VIBR|nr:fimbrial protein [Vibrio hippocampi]CAH0530406.1 hypothetical protein VHP8226_04049 [Vibrio hippocampi]
MNIQYQLMNSNQTGAAPVHKYIASLSLFIVFIISLAWSTKPQASYNTAFSQAQVAALEIGQCIYETEPSFTPSLFTGTLTAQQNIMGTVLNTISYTKAGGEVNTGLVFCRCYGQTNPDYLHFRANVPYPRTTVTFPDGTTDSGFFQINPYIALKVEIDLITAGTTASAVTKNILDVQSTKHTNYKTTDHLCKPGQNLGFAGDAATRWYQGFQPFQVETAMTGEVTIALLKPVINQITMTNQPIATIYATVSEHVDPITVNNPNDYWMQLSIDIDVDALSHTCVPEVENHVVQLLPTRGNNFDHAGAIPNNYSATSFDLTYVCDFKADNSVKMALFATPANSNYPHVIKANYRAGSSHNDNLGVVVKQRNGTGTILNPTTMNEVNHDIYSNVGVAQEQYTFELEAYPTKTTNDEVIVGEYEASATIQLSFD